MLSLVVCAAMLCTDVSGIVEKDLKPGNNNALVIRVITPDGVVAVPIYANVTVTVNGVPGVRTDVKAGYHVDVYVDGTGTATAIVATTP